MRNPESYDQMLATLRQVWASHLIAVRLKQPGLGPCSRTASMKPSKPASVSRLRRLRVSRAYYRKKSSQGNGTISQLSVESYRGPKWWPGPLAVVLLIAAGVIVAWQGR